MSTSRAVEDFNDYINALSNHDWYYDYSDDMNVWRHGKAKQSRLSAQAKTNPFYQEALAAYMLCAFSSTGSWVERVYERDNRIEAIRKQIAHLEKVGLPIPTTQTENLPF